MSMLCQTFVTLWATCCRFEVKFRDGVSQTCGRNKLLAASLLSPGDVVCFSTLGSSAFQDGLLLEYDKEYDQFHVARTDGVIFRC